jgi:hypothetical protein
MSARKVPQLVAISEFDSIPDDAVRSLSTARKVSSTDFHSLEDNNSNGPASGLEAFFAHRVRKSGENLVVDSDPRGSTSSSDVGVKREYDDSDTAPDADAVLAKKDTNKKARTETEALRLSDVPVQFHKALHAAHDLFKVSKLKYQVIEDSSKKLITSLENALECSKDALTCKENLVVHYEEVIAAMKAKFKDSWEIEMKISERNTAIIDLLKKTNITMKSQLKETAELLTITNEEHEEQMKSIRLGVNELRYVTEFGESSTRGAAICPISLTQLMPKETVIMFLSECSCNCMVGFESSGPFMKKYAEGEELQCLKCNSDVTSIKATTTTNGEIFFAWRDIEATTECHSIDEVYKARHAKMDQDKADKILQDRSAMSSNAASG